MPSGEQFTISSGKHEATIVEVGGGIRSYDVDGIPLLDGYEASDMCTGARGLPLIPWPNRLEDGAYTFDDVDHQLALTEPDKHNAIHGLLRARNWVVSQHTDDRVEIGTVLHPCQGYPFCLDVSVEYAVNGIGLAVRTTATNVGQLPCPYGAGQHPYLWVGTDTIDTCSLQVKADSWLPTDHRGLPTGVQRVGGSPYDFRTDRTIGEQAIDNTFTDLARDSDGLAWVRFAAPSGRGVEVWLDRTYPFLEIYTADTQPHPHWRRGLGVEPMTCGPNAYRSGNGLIRLEPGQTVTSRWGIQPA
ncbi:MAG: aldose 1-epimerase family protein [Nocardioidaceae bacterium]